MRPRAVQHFFGEHVHLSVGNTKLGLRARKVHGSAMGNNLVHALLPVSVAGLEEDMVRYQNITQKMQPTLSRPRADQNTTAFCSCRKRRQEKRFAQRPFVLTLNESHFHKPSCSCWVPGSHDMEVGFGIILYYLIFGFKIRLFMRLLVGTGTFSIMPSLSLGRIVTEESSPAFRLIDIMRSQFHETEPRDYSAELTKIFQTRQASPNERLGDGRTLLHVSFGASVLIVQSFAEI